MSKVYVKMLTVLKNFVNYNVCIFLVMCAMCVDFTKQRITNNFASTHVKLVTFGIMGIYLCAIRTGGGSVWGFEVTQHGLKSLYCSLVQSNIK